MTWISKYCPLSVITVDDLIGLETSVPDQCIDTTIVDPDKKWPNFINKMILHT